MGLVVLCISFICFGTLTIMFPQLPFDAELMVVWKTV